MTRLPPLLMIAEGRRPRPRKAAVERPREIVLHMAVVDLLEKLGDPAWRWTHIPNGEHRDIRTAAKLKRMGTKPGWPDFLLLSPRGIAHQLELKRDGAQLSEAQEAHELWCIAKGVPYAVAWTFDEAMATLTHWGAVRPVVG